MRRTRTATFASALFALTIVLAVGGEQVDPGRLTVVPSDVPPVLEADVEPFLAVSPGRYDAQSTHAPSPH